MSTDGIDIEDFAVDGLRIKAWDFAGQEVTFKSQMSDLLQHTPVFSVR